jgi:hypothetical protein
MEADDSLPYLAHCNYSEDFFLGPEQANPDGCSYYRSYLDDNGDPFLSCVIGRVRDILPISTSRQVKTPAVTLTVLTLSQILVLGKPPVSPELRQLFHESCAVADDVMATDRVQGSRVSPQTTIIVPVLIICSWLCRRLHGVEVESCSCQ